MSKLRFNKKAFLCLALVIITVASLFAVMAMPTGAEQSEGASFNETTVYKMERPVPTHTSFTFESEFWLDPSFSHTERAYSLIGNYANSGRNNTEWGVELHKYGSVRLFHQTNGSVYFHGGANTQKDPSDSKNAAYLAEMKAQYYDKGEFPLYDVRKYMGTADNPTYVKLAITVDTVEGEATLYINGNEIITIKDEKVLKGRTYNYHPDHPHIIGGDYRSANFFKGKIKSVTMYDYVRESAAIKNNFANTADNELLFAYDLTNIQNGALVDMSKNSIDAHSAASTYLGGRKISAEETLYVQKEFDVMPRTYEAFVYIPSASRSGVILGNYSGSGMPGINFEIHGSNSAPRTPSLYITDEQGNTFSEKFNVNLTANSWVHLVITHERANTGAKFTCYVNGVQAGDSITANGLFYEYDLNMVTNDNYLRLGGDSRDGNSQNYKGNIKNVALYSEVLTAAEIKELYGSGINSSREDLILYYNLCAPENQSGTQITDEAGNGYDIGPNNNIEPDYDPFFEREEAIGDYDYAFAIVGDTQKLVYHDVHNEEGELDYVHYIYDWLVANKDSKKIGLVMGVGDITDQNEPAEYELAKTQFEKLGEAGMLYTITPGNHDMKSEYANYNKYFAGSESENISPLTSLTNNISGYYQNDSSQVKNYYVKTTVAGEKYIIFSFEYGAPDAVLNWAGEICDANPDYKVIITTHAYMYRDGTTLDEGDVVPPNKSDSTSDDHRNNGDMAWEKFLSQHENIVLAFSGHDPCPNVIMRQDLGVNGNVVSQFLVDFQSMDTKLKYETGMVAMLYISKNGNVKVEYISTYRTAEARKINPAAQDILYKESNQFSFNMNEMPEELCTEYGMVPYEYRSTDLYPFVIFDQNRNFQYVANNFLYAIERGKLFMDDNVYDPESEKYTGTYRRAYIVMRRDYKMSATESNNNLAQVQGLMTIDLGGYTITTTKDGKNMFPSSIKPWTDSGDVPVYPTEFLVKNGNIIVNKTLIGFNSWKGNSDIDVSGKKFAYSFEDISFKVCSNVENVIAAYAIHNSTPEAEGNPELTFIDCVFDLTEAKSGVVLFNKGNAYTDATITVYGCKIIAGSADFVWETETNSSAGKTTNDGSLTFFKNKDGNYVTVIVPTGTALPVESVNDGQLVFVKAGEAEGMTTYILAPKTLINYTPKMSITLSSTLIMNVYIPINSTQNFTLCGVSRENLEYKTATIDKKDYYVVSVPLGSAEAAKNIELLAIVSDGENEAKATFTFSIPKYAHKVLNNPSATTEEKTLVKSVVAYIQAAYNYFVEFNDESEIERVNAVVDEIIAIGDEFAGDPVTNGETNVIDPVSRVTLNLKANPTIRFYVSDTTVEFFAGGKKLNTVVGTDETYGDYVELDVYAYVLCQTIYYGDGGSYHISDFLAGSFGTDHEYLVACFLKYVESAAAYRDSVIGAEN